MKTDRTFKHLSWKLILVNFMAQKRKKATGFVVSIYRKLFCSENNCQFSAIKVLGGSFLISERKAAKESSCFPNIGFFLSHMSEKAN